MNEDEFRTIVQNEWANVPPRFVKLIENVALLIEDEPNAEIRAKEHLKENETLLGLYQGIPHTERGSMYGVGATLPDTITLFRLPILSEAEELTDTDTSLFQKNVATVVRETIWHEVGHYFGLNEHEIDVREQTGTNEFGTPK